MKREDIALVYELIKQSKGDSADGAKIAKQIKDIRATLKKTEQDGKDALAEAVKGLEAKVQKLSKAI